MFEFVDIYQGRSRNRVSPDQVRAIGQRLGFELPDSYVTAASKYGGYHFDVDHRYVRYVHRRRSIKDVLTLSKLFHFDERIQLWSVQDAFVDAEKELPKGLL